MLFRSYMYIYIYIYIYIHRANTSASHATRLLGEEATAGIPDGGLGANAGGGPGGNIGRGPGGNIGGGFGGNTGRGLGRNTGRGLGRNTGRGHSGHTGGVVGAALGQIPVGRARSSLRSAEARIAPWLGAPPVELLCQVHARIDRFPVWM